MTPLQSLTTLIQLDVGSNRLKGTELVSCLEHLSYLDLRENQIDNMSPVARLKKLKVLYVKGNPAAGITSLDAVRDELLLKDF